MMCTEDDEFLDDKRMLVIHVADADGRVKLK